MAVTYKSSTGETINVGSYVVTVEPGLQLTQAVEELDALVGISLTRTNTSATELKSYPSEIVTCVPVIIPNSSTVATNGGITVTALPTTYSGGAWVYLPAGAVVGGSAGYYWTVFSSTTAGSVKTNYINPTSEFLPYVPTGTLTTAVGSNASYTTPAATDINMLNIALPANHLRDNSPVRMFSRIVVTNSADDKIVKHILDTAAAGNLVMGSQTYTTSTGGSLNTAMFSRSSNKQVTGTLGTFGDSTTSTTTYGTIDTTVASNLLVTGQLEVTTSDYIVLEAFISSITIA